MRRKTGARSRTGQKAEAFDLKREKILDVAAELFNARGYTGTTVDAIAAGLGVTKPFIYYHFPDKAAILAEICERAADLTGPAMEQARVQDGTWRERIRWFSRRLSEIIIDHRQFLGVYMREDKSLREEDHRRIMRQRAAIDRDLAEMIAAGTCAGEFNCGNAVLTSRAITGMITWVQVWYRGTTAEERESVVEHMANLAVAMLEA